MKKRYRPPNGLQTMIFKRETQQIDRPSFSNTAFPVRCAEHGRLGGLTQAEPLEPKWNANANSNHNKMFGDLNF